MTTIAKPKPNLVSPDHMMAQAKAMMLDGLEPQSDEDWMRLANFWAFNIKDGLEVTVTCLMGAMYQCPLDKRTLTEIGEHQARVKARRKPGRTSPPGLASCSPTAPSK